MMIAFGVWSYRYVTRLMMNSGKFWILVWNSGAVRLGTVGKEWSTLKRRRHWREIQQIHISVLHVMCRTDPVTCPHVSVLHVTCIRSTCNIYLFYM